MKSNLFNLFAVAIMAFVPLALSAQVPSYVPTDGLVGWWPLNGSVSDLSGNNYNGSIQGGAASTVDRFGAPAAAIALANGGQSCSLPAPIAGTFTNAMSYSFWYKELNYPSTANQILFYAAGKYLVLQPQSAGITALTGGVFNVVGSNSNIASAGWKHVVVVYEEFAVTLYINGVIANSTASNVLPDPIQFLNSASQVGGTDGVNPFSGSVDDVGFWNRALNRNEVGNLFNASITTPQVSLPNYLPSEGLVGWWPLDGNTYDYSGNGRDAGVSIGSMTSSDRFGNVEGCYSLMEGQGCILPYTEAGTYVDAMSYSFWYQEAEFPTSDFSGLFFAAGKSLLLSPESSGLRVYSGTSEYADAFSDDLFTDQWKHVVVIYSGQTVAVYINGVLSVTNEYIEPVTYENIISFGGGYAGGNYIYNGKIDDIAMYNRALSINEISSLYLNEPVSAPECLSLPSNLQTGLVGYWPFCGNANDESGNGNDGVVNGATLTEDRFGNVNAAYGFDGLSNYIEVQDDNSIDLTNQYSLSAWVEIPDYSLNNSEYPQRTILSKPRPVGGTGYSMIALTGNEVPGLNDLRYGSGWNNDITNGFLTSSDTLPLDSWSHIVFTYDGVVAKLFKNGVESNSGSLNLNLLNSDQPLFFGKEFDFNNALDNRWFKGSLDDIGIWNRALTPEEIQELYTLDACTFTVYDTLTVENIINVYDTLNIENIVDIFDTTYIIVEVYDTLTVENIINVYDTLTIENIVDIFDTTYINVEVYDTLTVENIINVYDTLTIENIVEVYDTLTIENVIDVYDTTTVVEMEVLYDTLTIENIVDVYDTLTIENVIDVYDTTTFVEIITVYDTLTVENVEDVYDTTYVTVTDTLIIDIPSGVGGTILNTLLLYPNPTSDQLTISYGNFAALSGYSLTIFDNGGSTVHETNITQAQESLDITQWSAGVYQVVVYNAGGVPVETRQIVIQ
jgi:hypothetical protein